MFTSFISSKTNIVAKLLLSVLATTTVVAWSTKSFSKPIPLMRNTLVAMESDDAELADLVKQVHQEINQYRSSLNLAPLSLDDLISKQAAIHSQNMAQGQVEFSHQGFDQRVKVLGTKIPYLRVSENVAYNQGYNDPASNAVKGWIKSEGHRQNMIGNYNLTGIGVARNQQGEYYFTQIFIGEK